MTHQGIGKYVKRMMAPTVAKVAAAAERKLSTVAEAAETILRWLNDIEAKESVEPGERDRFRLLMEGFDRVARLRGLYPKEGVQVGVQINIDKAAWVREFIESIPDDDLRQRLLAFLRG